MPINLIYFRRTEEANLFGEQTVSYSLSERHCLWIAVDVYSTHRVYLGNRGGIQCIAVKCNTYPPHVCTHTCVSGERVYIYDTTCL